MIAALPARSPRAQATFEVLHEFSGGPGNGAVALGALMQGPEGNLFGTTQRGGAFGLGTVYRVSPAGIVTIIHHFSGTEGALPAAGLVMGSDGAYGTTVAGGTGHGTVFRIRVTPPFTVTVMHAFAGFDAGDGDAPYAPLVIHPSDGSFYGVTFSGGQFGSGTIFRLTRFGVYSIVHMFDNSAQGESSPFGGLVVAGDNYMYGTTRGGLVYRINSFGTYNAVHRLNAATEGATVHSVLAPSADGDTLYGTAREGGPNGFGSIFGVAVPSGSFSVVHAFTDGADGAGPDAGLIRGPDDNFYGTTVGTYVSTAGRRLFRFIPSSNTLTPLHTFVPSDSQPSSLLLYAEDGALYGTTNGGNASQPGRSIVYRVSNVFPALGPPFGSFDTPFDGATVAGEVPVTGWALDDGDVPIVEIYRSSVPGEPTQPNGLVFLGSATSVEGARPDVAALFPQYPSNTRAGWGYMLLSNALPNGGDGAFTLTATARDAGGSTTVLGQRTMTAANSANPGPFGTIDTPAQGAVVSGVVLNWGWALSPAEIQADGSTITVYVDGIALGHPTYGLDRSDIATLFPGYPNTHSAVGYFSLDTRTLTNGVHVLAWVVVDGAGKSQGIGSRYINVLNP